jgi:alcohol dehydrogenase class IV
MIAGPGSVEALREIVGGVERGRGRSPSFAVVHGGSLGNRPSGCTVLGALRGLEHATFVHRGTPTPASVAELARSLREHRLDMVVAVGGGAVVDAAKAAAVLSGRAGLDAGATIAACAERQDGPPGAVVVAVPTTAGTGAEATPFATIWDFAGGRKLSLAGRALLPYAAVLDPGLLEGLPLRVLAGGILDTIAQGAEAAWSKRSTVRSTALGLRAVREAGARLDLVAEGPLELDDLAALQLAGHRSGQAIAIANTTACHAVSYALTLRYGLAHGHACGVAFGRLADFNAGVTPATCTDPRGAGRVRATVGRIADALGTVPGRVAPRLDEFLAAVDLPRLADLDVDYARVAADAASYPRCHDNPASFDGRLAEILAAPVQAALACA